ncbi:uncharacterized protein LOC143451721 [Clavelina lepadiformis]|uniref:uncharacterized protein LOC143451721 n=1 Tax=Clavelina lepadiformis TaxID=159417 RepID=UPI0040423834
MAEVGRKNLTENDLTSDIMEREKARPFLMRPTLNYKSGPMCSMPKTIDPDNWTEITPQELKAHKERLSINGRLRREMWMRAYHPEHYKHFSTVNSDMAFLRYGRVRTVWHIKDTVKTSGWIPIISLATVVTFLGVHIWGCMKVEKYHEKHDTIFDKINPRERPAILRFFDWNFAPTE